MLLLVHPKKMHDWSTCYGCNVHCFSINLQSVFAWCAYVSLACSQLPINSKNPKVNTVFLCFKFFFSIFIQMHFFLEVTFKWELNHNNGMNSEKRKFSSIRFCWRQIGKYSLNHSFLMYKSDSQRTVDRTVNNIINSVKKSLLKSNGSN